MSLKRAKEKLAESLSRSNYKTGRSVGTFWKWPDRTWLQQRLKKLARQQEKNK
jgi:hypothetical protein